jgi:flagellar M-ring protein FliF
VAAGPQGVPGATSNTPPGPSAAQPNPNAGAAAANAAQPAAAAPAESSRSATRNYELDRTLQHTRQTAGRIKRVSVAVLVDRVPRPGAGGKTVEQALSPAELARVEALVKDAVGFDAARGDTVSVMNAPFVREPVAPEEGPEWWEDPRVRDALRLLLGAAVVLALLFGVLRPTLRQITRPAKAARRAGEPETVDIEAQDDAGMLAGLEDDTARIAAPKKPSMIALPSDAYEDRLRQAREAVQADSKRVAQVVKGWLAHEA